MTHESPRSGFVNLNALKATDIGRYLELQGRRPGAEAGWTLVILDCCKAGTEVTAALERYDQVDEYTVPLLRSLAYSLGLGFPQREGIWKKVTEAIHPGLTIRERDIANTLQVAAAYIVHDGEFGTATYRLAHRTFAEHFLAEP